MEELIRLEHLSKNFTMGRKYKINALTDISFSINKGETLGIVGESGCGKSTLARIIMGVSQPTCGKVLYEGKIVNFNRKKERLAYARKAQIIFQDPYSALDPRMTVEKIILEGMEIHKMFDKETRHQRVLELLEMVGLNKEYANRFPHEFSGGQRQRIGIARALAVEPKFIVCDEPISALDVSVQSHIMNLLKDLKDSLGQTYLFIAHDLNMVRYISDRIAVIYLGYIVELGTVEGVYFDSKHPYTKTLLESVLIPDPEYKSFACISKQQKEHIESRHTMVGCSYYARCEKRETICFKQNPNLKEVEPGHYVACHIM